MLNHIHIRNFAIIEELDLELDQGLTVLTGETGAGKSILIDAIGLVMGDRADSGSVKHGSDKAEITLSVDVTKTATAGKWLEQQDLDNDGECILRRVITTAGKSRAWINGSPCNLAMLKQLGEQVVDIHGQHEHQSLMKKGMQRQMLDEFAENHKLLEQTASAWQQWNDTHQRYQSLLSENEEHLAKLDLLRFQVDELEKLGLADNEISTLDDEHNRLANADQLQQIAGSAQQELYEDEQSVYSALSNIVQTLEQKVGVDSALVAPLELVSSAQIQLQEAAEELRHYLDKLSIDPERLMQLETRISDVQSMARKHRIDAEELPAKLEKLQADLGLLDSDEYNLESLEKQLQTLKESYYKLAEKLTAKRKKAAKKLSAGVTKTMQELSMKGGVFEIHVTPLTDDKTPTINGMDNVIFMVSANPGQPVQPIVKVASGGELSRISLAIQMIAAQKITLPALIFDEVDTGIGGGTAEIVGKQLRKLGENRQVLCVTHLPQVAAQSHHHYQVTKIKGKNSTSTGIIKLKANEKIEEIARMMGGVEITDSTLALAKEMIEQ
ncbi:MAG TPA: DNA repair protein RecN [Thiothrix sp.]|nr:DNA repair protein RecN [Thiothrix sp.]